jgi:hypothetical protein
VLTRPLRMLLLAAIATSGMLAGELIDLPMSDLIGAHVAMAQSPLAARCQGATCAPLGTLGASSTG